MSLSSLIMRKTGTGRPMWVKSRAECKFSVGTPQDKESSCHLWRLGNGSIESLVCGLLIIDITE